ncbi:tetratricopeptide repeat protein [Streptomyces sp. NPDC001835]|uniref:tetratricopeptide repeat protein n=1 Tax=Streptomyces sp. NPDC001835 TaxID=3154528 RepID=UPI0033313872
MANRSVAELREYVAALEASQGPRALETTTARHDLAGALHESGELLEAVEQYALAWDCFARRFGPSHLITLTCLNNFALVMRDLCRWDEALNLFDQVHAERAAQFGPAHPLTLNAANNFLSVLVRKGDLAAAADEYPAFVEACEYTFGPEDDTALSIRRDYADVLRRLGRHDEVVRVLGASAMWPVGRVLIGCARLLRYTALFPVAMTASRYGAEMTLSLHGTARTDLGAGRELRDDDLGIRCAVVAPRDLLEPYDPAEDLRTAADQVADALGALGEHLSEADRELGEGRLRVRVLVHHSRWPRLSLPPSLTVDRRLMSARDRARHDRVMRSTPHHPAPEPAGRRGRLGSRGGFSVRLTSAPHVTVSTSIGLDAVPPPSPAQA